MKAQIVFAALAALTLTAVGCAPNTKSGRGFHLPAGDIAKGQAAFVELKCHACHRVDGVELPPVAVKPESVVLLGGEVTRLRTYGQLVTAIIHPSLEISDRMVVIPPKPVVMSPMKDFNREITVAQLVDIVTFLEPRYRQLEQRANGMTY